MIWAVLQDGDSKNKWISSSPTPLILLSNEILKNNLKEFVAYSPLKIKGSCIPA